MRTGLPFVLLALVIAALVVPVSYALSLNPPLPEPADGQRVWSVVANTSFASSGVRMPRRYTPTPEPPDGVRLFLAGSVLVGLASVARRGRRDRLKL
jgi:hypothetical protein